MEPLTAVVNDDLMEVVIKLGSLLQSGWVAPGESAETFGWSRVDKLKSNRRQLAEEQSG